MGHSKFANKPEGKNDAVRGKIFTKIGRELAVAVKKAAVGSCQQQTPRCYLKAKANNMPNDKY